MNIHNHGPTLAIAHSIHRRLNSEQVEEATNFLPPAASLSRFWPE
jgi:hypothetical protein